MKILVRAVLLLFAFTVGMGILPAQKSGKTKSKDPAGTRRLASVDGTAITETQARMEGAKDLDSLELQVLKAKAVTARKEHEILEDALERLIEDKLLQTEAKKQGISKDELLTREVQRKITEPTAEEIDSFYKNNKQRIRGSKEEVAPQISKYLKKEQESELKSALMKRIEKEHKVVRLLQPFRYDVGGAGRPSLGPASAPVTLVLFSDFQCPYCKNFGETVKEVVKNYPNRVRLVFRQFPLTSIHTQAQRAAEASLCADAQGRFWEMHDQLFQNQSNLKDEDLKNRADKLGLDVAAFNACLNSARYSKQVDEDIRAGTAAGVEGTPALFVNGRFLYGSRPYEEIVALIDEELKMEK